MQLLYDYLKQLSEKSGKNEVDAFAKRCGTSTGQLKQVAGGYRRAGESLAINIERESGGAVRCEDLRPDVDWEYLRRSKPRRRRSDRHSPDPAGKAKQAHTADLSST